MLNERSVQTVSTPFNISKSKGNVESMLNESLNQFKFDSTHFQQAFNILLRFQQCLTTCSNAPDVWLNNCVESILKQMLKPFKQASLRTVLNNNTLIDHFLMASFDYNYQNSNFVILVESK